MMSSAGHWLALSWPGSSQTQKPVFVSNIRQIGDPLLHSEVAAVNFKDPNFDLNSTIKILQDNLNNHGGVGIAANQCCQLHTPHKMIIVGIYDQALMDLLKQRYPDSPFPNAKIMLNPRIISTQGEPYFPGEGCMSVEGGMRGKVARFPSIEIEYYDPEENIHHENLTGFAAHIAQHESDHLHGILYLDHAFKELKQHDLIQVKNHIHQELSQRQALNIEPEISQERHLAFDRDSDQNLILVKEKLQLSIQHMPSVTLTGILNLIESRYV